MHPTPTPYMPCAPWLRCGVLAAVLAMSASAHATQPGIGQSGGVSWEQLRFYGPSGSANTTYPGGQPTSFGSVATGSDLCADRDICGSTLVFNSLLGGKLRVSATSTSGNAVVRQDLDPSYGGLGVQGYQAATTSQQWVWKSTIPSSLRTSKNIGSTLLGSYRTVSTPAVWKGDDEIDAGDTLTLSFEKTVRVIGAHFFDGNHGQSKLAGDFFGLSIDGAPSGSLSFSGGYPFNDQSTLIGRSFTFSRASTRGEDYYLGAIKFAEVFATPVPEPTVGALFLAGLAALGARRRRFNRHRSAAA